ncbi:uncharacterized protein LOC100203068 isoform X1 [Hydra vulgaris]|uniref:uncharacterized protein LOC100203068 isoform X1 n=2 Tax=Hydra vulgaris TaxID=6087 RepID=UPI001F5FBD00|nr:uncharacterized protein LOC100203068 isoform X1 [Hydra vulgaris]XP_047124049.1 uncharacterized protein LOC100203068 isoform X1 [Hydra vulgaris]
MVKKMLLAILIYIKFQGFLANDQFPLKEYWNISNLIWNIETSEFLCQSNSFPMCCSCSSTCFLYKTCCIDIYWNKNDPLPLFKYMDKIVNTSKTVKDAVCESLAFNGYNQGHFSASYMMVHSCLKEANIEDKYQCTNISTEDLFQNIPVIGSDKLLYRNAACAKCNFASYEQVNLTIQCSGIKSGINLGTNLKPENKNKWLDILEEYKGCSTDIEKNGYIEKYILPCGVEDTQNDFVKSCPIGNPYHNLCNSYSGKLNINNKIYKNFDCYKCANNNLGNLNEDHFICRQPPPIFESNEWGEMNWAVLININNKSKVKKSYKFNSPDSAFKCSDGYILDTFTNKCEKSEKENKNNNLISYDSSLLKCHWNSYLHNAGFESFNDCLFSQQPSLFLFVNDTSNLTAVNEMFLEAINSSLVISSSKLKKANKIIFRTNETFTYEKLQSFRKHQSTIFSYATSVFISSIKNQEITEMYGFDLTRSYKNKRVCAQPETIRVSDNYSASSFNSVYSNITDEEVVLWIDIAPSGVENKYISFCKLFHLQQACFYNVIKNFTLEPNQTIVYYYNNKHFTYLPNEYIPLANGVGVCKESDKNIALTWKTKVLNVANIISNIGTSVSVLCYLTIIIVYTYFKELRTWSSVTSTTLCINFFFADFTFLISTQVSKKRLWCEVFSILLHWFLLVAYHSLLILALDVATTFGSYNHRFSKRKKLIQYFIVIYVIPSIYLFINVTLEKTGIAYIGYGDGVCWMQEFYAKLFSFIIPIVIIILTSLSCLLFTVYKITLSEKKSNDVFGEGRTSRVDVARVALKLTLILGVIELIGFVQISKSSLSEGEETFNIIVAIIYMVFRSAKGILLFVAYICTPKVQKIITSIRFIQIKSKGKTNTRQENYSSTAFSSLSQ